MKTRFILTMIFTLIFLSSCHATEDDKFTLTGRIENAGELENIQVYEGETVAGSIELGNNGEFHFEGNAPDATLYTLLVDQRPFMLILKNGEKVEFNADLADPGNYTVKGSETSAKLKELDTISETFREQQRSLQEEFEQRMSRDEEISVIQHDLMAKNDSYVSALSEKILPFSLENKKNLAGFYGMLTLYSIDPTGHEEEMIRYMEEIQSNF